MRRMLTMTLALMLMSGCALISQIQGMTPKQKAVWMMSAFTSQLNAVRLQAVTYWHDDTTEAARLLMRWKMTLLKKAYPLIEAYVEAVDNGTEPGLNVESAVFQILNLVIDGLAGDVPPGMTLVDPPLRPLPPANDV